MDKLFSLFTRIGEFLNSTSWFPLIKWPFWTLLVIIAICGLYTARFNKKSLFTLGVQGALKLAIIYMVATAGYLIAPDFMSGFSELPFLSVSDGTLTLVNPLSVLDRWNLSLPIVIVRLYFLLLFINAVSVLDYNPANPLTWSFFQCISTGAAVLIYSGFFYLVTRFWPGPVELFYRFMALLITAFFLIILALKFYFTFVSKEDNNAFQKVYKFLTTQNYGKQLTVSVLSFLVVIVYLVVAAFNGHNTLDLGSFSYIAFALNGVMCASTLYAFCRYFNG